MALVEDASVPHFENCSLDVRSKGRSCIRGESFGCLAGDRPGVWVRGGCRGQFAANGLRVACGHPGLGEQEQKCHAVRFRSAGTDTTDVWAAGSVRSLDDSKRFLDRAPWQTLAQALLRSTTDTGTTILVGVINGHAERRAPFRCEFAQLLPSRGRLRFVVGSDAPARVEETDLLVVPDVPEFIHYHNVGGGGGGGERSARRWEGTGSMSSLLKLFYFLEWAARQPEQVIARVDDDVFVSLSALEAHAAALAPFGEHFYAGVFEWYSYIPAIFKSTGHSFGVDGARTFGQRLHNCTPSAVRGSEPGSGCVGPAAFAKGPLLLLSRAVARDAVRAAADDIARARTFRPQSRVDDDVFLGSLVAAMPHVTYVRLRRKETWLDRTPAELHPRRLLLAHKMPWECHSAMVEASAAAGWARGALYRVACGAEPPCLLCAHASTQRTCAIQLEAGEQAGTEPHGLFAALQPNEPGRVAWCNVSQGFTPQPATLPGGGDCAFRGVPKGHT